MLRSKKNHKTHHRKYKKTLKMNGGASFFGPLTQYLSNTSKVNEQVEKMSQDKNNLMDSMTQLTKTYNNVLSNVTELESRINGLSDLKNQCIGLYPTIAPSTSTSNNNGIFSFFNPSTTEEQKNPQEGEETKEEEPKEKPTEETKEEETKEEEQKEKPTENAIGEFFGNLIENPKPNPTEETKDETKEEEPKEKPKENSIGNFFSNLIENPTEETKEETKEFRESDFPIDTNDLRSNKIKETLNKDFDDLKSQGNRILEGENKILDREEDILNRLSRNESQPLTYDMYEDLPNDERKPKMMGGKRRTKKHKRRIKKLSKKYYL
jgi:hypothetical protein